MASTGLAVSCFQSMELPGMGPGMALQAKYFNDSS